MSRHRVFWGWINKRSKIAHAWTHYGPYDPYYALCGVLMSYGIAPKRKGTVRRCKNCERALRN